MNIRKYKVLRNQIFKTGDYSIVPIREEDKLLIMNWRNEQIYHLRQSQALTEDAQKLYFKNTVAVLFEQEKPSQLLFSYLKKDECIGYGGLVHINWIDRNAELSFIMNTSLESDFFEFHWKTYLSLIEQVAFEELHFHKIFTYAFDLRPKLYSALFAMNFQEEARLAEHCFFDGHFRDVLIHSKRNTKIVLEPAFVNDADKTFEWATDKKVRQYSISTNEIKYEEHHLWFSSKVKDARCLYYIAYNSGIAIGSFRVDIDDEGAGTISYLLASPFHGKGLGGNLLRAGLKLAKTDLRIKVLVGQVFKENKVSCLLFEKLNFTMMDNHSNPLLYKLKVR